ncbi:MAG: nuclear transport factor 2 family protein [Nocardia sp.]|nr:nuclear transport factor 2 family protein [Nocardia sp.]
MPELGDYPLRKYFEALDAGDNDAIFDLFADNAIYIRPAAPTPDSPELGGLSVVEGKAALKEYFDRRGVLSLRHYIRASATEGRHNFVEGVVRVPDVPGITDMVFMCHAVFDEDGLICWYAGNVDVVTAEQAQQIEASRKVW